MSKKNLVQRMLEATVGDNAFVNFVSGLGTARDKASGAQYLPVARKSVLELNNVYHSDWLGQRIINKPAGDAMRAGWYMSNVDADQSKLIRDACKYLKINKVLLKAMVLARLHGWSYLLVGATDSSDLEEPLDLGVGQLSFFTVLKREQLRNKKDGEMLSPMVTAGDVSMPVYYEVGAAHDVKYIHHTRVIRIDAPDLVGGEDGMPMPVLQQVYETLMRHVSVQANASSLVYEAKVDVIKVPELMNNFRNSTFETVSTMIQRFTSLATLKGNNGMLVLDADEEYDSKSFTFAGLPELMREFSLQTAGAAEMPYSLLFGESVSGMNSTGDFEMRSYYDGINSMQENVLREPLEQVLSLITLSLGIAIEDLGLIFNPLWQLDEKTRSEIEKNNAERDSVYLERGIVTEGMIAQQLLDDGTYTTITDEHIKLLDDIAGQSYELSDEVTVA